MTPQQAAALLLKRRLIRRDYLTWARSCQSADQQPQLHHRVMGEHLQAVAEGRIRKLMIFAPPGSAKALALDTPIPTPSGWTTMGALRVGDRVFDELGRPCNVVWKSQVWRDRPCYEVKTDCGDAIVADRDHEWLVRLCGKPRPALKSKEGDGRRRLANRDAPISSFKIKETWELARRRAKRPMITRNGELQLPDAELSLDPWVLGAWLGDGTSAGGEMSCSDADAPWMRAQFEQRGFPTRDRAARMRFGVTGLRGKLDELGLLGNKHVPAAYFRGSAHQRRELLQGLIDTDGSVRSDGYVSFCSTKRALADGVAELVRSLGAKVTVRESRATLKGKDCGPVWRLSFYLAGAALMPRKAIGARNQTRTPGCYIDVTPTENRDTVCIEVDSPSHLFLCGRSMTPTHNSTYGSILFPTWFMAHPAGGHVLAASHNAQLAQRFSRKVRGLATSHGHTLGYGLRETAVERWSTTGDREYLAAGVGVGIAGFRADLGLVDDPIRSRQDADSKLVRDRIWEWYEDDFENRLRPGARQIVINCMTGDTPVLMADGSERRLDRVRPGDQIATYDGSGLAVSTVENWANQGSDYVYEITMISGITVRANTRHPFLVVRDGVETWTRLGKLRVGDRVLRVTGASGRASRAPMKAAMSPCDARGSACRITSAPSGPVDTGRPRSTLSPSVIGTGGTGTALSLKTMRPWSLLKAAFAPSAGTLRRQASACPSGGEAASLSIIATTASASEGFSAMTATSLSPEAQRQKSLSAPLSTYVTTLDEIESIKPAGRAFVYDIQVAGTENFIANGLASHNTRWHEDDLSGRLIERDGMVSDEKPDGWDVLSIPALAGLSDPLGRFPGQYLWDDDPAYRYGARLRERHAVLDTRSWSALFQQEPTPDTGDFFRAEWLIPVDSSPKDARAAGGAFRFYGASDYAVTANGGDYTVHAVVGLDADDNPWLVDLWRQQASSDVWVDAWCDLVRKWRPLGWAEELGQIKAGVGPFLKRAAAERKAYTVREQFPTRGDKATRAQSFRGMIASRGLRIPGDARWRQALESEMLRFPAGVHDDQVDALGLIGQLLDKALAAAPPRKPDKGEETGYAEIGASRGYGDDLMGD